MSSTSQPPPGWFPDPEDPARLRWWDGAQWTQDYHTPAAVDAPAEPAGPTTTPPGERLTVPPVQTPAPNAPTPAPTAPVPPAPEPTAPVQATPAATATAPTPPPAKGKALVWLLLIGAVVVLGGAAAAVLVVRSRSVDVAATGSTATTASTAPATTSTTSSAGGDATSTTRKLSDTTRRRPTTTEPRGLPDIGTEKTVTIAEWDPDVLWQFRYEGLVVDPSRRQSFSMNGTFQGEDLAASIVDQDGVTKEAVILGSRKWERTDGGAWEESTVDPQAVGVGVTFELGSYNLELKKGDRVRARVVDHVERDGMALAVWELLDPDIPAGAVLQVLLAADDQMMGFEGRGEANGISLDTKLEVAPAPEGTPPIRAPADAP